MTKLIEYDVVRIKKLINQDRKFDGTEAVQRAPKIGDIGTVVYDYDPKDSNSIVTVEMVDEYGFTIWLADFFKSELELVERSE